jgi:thiol-disulfide isomerase/thioredoxin
LRGKVVLVDFWTYSCINCLRTLPDLGNLYDRYKDKGLVVIGVHTPEFEFEKDFSNVKKAVERLAIRYPVTLDNHYEIWKAYHNAYWPAHYLIDQQGNIRYVHFGEGAEVEMENAIRQLLMETPLTVPEVIVEHRAISPETYLGYGRADHYVMPITADVEKEYSFTFPLPKEGVGLQGKWKVGKEFIESEGDESSISLEFLATRVYLVLAGRSDRPLSVELDQKPLSKVYFTSDMNVDGQLFVKEARKYDVINLHKQYQRRTLTLHIPKGIQAYAFTFGDED